VDPRWGSSTRSVQVELARAVLTLALVVIVVAPVAASAGALQADDGPDTDSDGVADSLDLDDDNDGLIDVDEGWTPAVCRDTDGDAVCDHLDLDSDNDGISDLIEAGLSWGVFDTDRNGVVDPSEFVDDDNDGLDDALEAAFGADSGPTPVDSDRNGVADHLDLDSDDDGIPDAVEALPSSGYLLNWSNDGNVADDDADGDGVWWAHDDRSGHGGTFVDPVRSDDDPLADYRDPDADEDGIADVDEGVVSGAAGPTHADPDGTIDDPSADLLPGSFGEPAYRTIPVLDADGDGLADTVDPDPGDSCVDPTAPGWTPRADNDCDADGVNVGAGDPDDFAASVPGTTTTTTTTPPTTTTVAEPDEVAGAVAPEEGAPAEPSNADGVLDEPSPELFDIFVESPQNAAEPGSMPAAGDQAVAGVSTMRVVGELILDVDADGEITDATEHLDGAVVELWGAGDDDTWRTADDILVSSGVHDGGYELPARAGEFEVRVVVSSLPDGVSVPDAESSRQPIGTARVRDGEVELLPFAYQPHSVCGRVTSDGLELPDAQIAVTDASGNTVQTRTDQRGAYCVVGSLDTPLEPGTATVAASAVGVSVLTEVLIEDGEVVAPVLALDSINLETAATALGFDRRTRLSDLVVVSGMALFVGLLASLVMRMVGGIPIESDPDDLIEC